MTDSSGTVVWAADYLPFGQADVTVETVENNLRFVGQYYDNETGLHYNYFRYYDPSLGRYLRADPIGLEGGINLYAYVENNSINLIDPFGLRAPNPIPPSMRTNPFHVPGDNSGPGARRAPGGSSSGCKNIIVKECEEMCCDYDECTGKCKTKCPMLSSPSSKVVQKCLKYRYVPKVNCQGKIF
jgi:RHS repeat-associated protein